MSDHSTETDSPLDPQLIARDGRAFFGSAGLAVSGQAITATAGIACTVITIRLLSRTAYGRFAIFFMLLEIVSHIIAWPNPGLVRFGREEMAGAGTLADTFWARLSLFLAGAAAVAILLFAAQRHVMSYVRLQEFQVHILLLLYVVLNGFVLMARSVFQTATRFRAYALTQCSVKLLNLAFIVVVFVLLGKVASPARILLVHIVSFALISCVCLVLLPWRLLLPVRIRMPVLKRMAAYSWPFLPAGLSALIVNWVDFAVIKHFKSDLQVGIYAAAYQPVTVIIGLQVALVSAVLPLLVSLAIEKRSRALTWYLDDVLPQIAWGLGLGSVVLATAAEAIPLALGGKYAHAVVPCQVLLAGVTFFVFAGFQAALAKALDRVKAVFLIGLLTAALNVLFDLVLVPRFGIQGAAIATAAAYILSGLFFFPVLNSERWLRRGGVMRRYGVYIGLAAPLFMAAAALMSRSWALRLIAASGIIAVWVIAARVLGIFRKDTLEKIERIHMPAFARSAAKRFYAVFGR